MYLVIILIAVFILVSILPLIEFLTSQKESFMTEYEFPVELINYNLDNLKFENKGEATVKRTTLQNRGSVRIAQGRILSEKDLEEKKVKAFSVKLP